MGARIYLVCEDHNPPIRNREDSGQNPRDLPRIRAEIRDREKVVAWARHPATYKHWRDGVTRPDFNPDDYFRERSARFLRDHPHCNIGIVDDEGRHHPTEEPDA